VDGSERLASDASVSGVALLDCDVVAWEGRCRASLWRYQRVLRGPAT
jgi:hypothetical protein